MQNRKYKVPIILMSICVFISLVMLVIGISGLQSLTSWDKIFGQKDAQLSFMIVDAAIKLPLCVVGLLLLLFFKPNPAIVVCLLASISTFIFGSNILSIIVAVLGGVSAFQIRKEDITRKMSEVLTKSEMEFFSTASTGKSKKLDIDSGTWTLSIAILGLISLPIGIYVPRLLLFSLLFCSAAIAQGLFVTYKAKKTKQGVGLAKIGMLLGLVGVAVPVVLYFMEESKRDEPKADGGVSIGESIRCIDANKHKVCMVSEASSLWCWDISSVDNTVKPKRVDDDTTWSSITSGSGHYCGLKNDGAVWCWGKFEGGMTRYNKSPVKVDLPAALNSVSAGGNHSCAVAKDGGLWCWGDNFVGQIGDGSTAKHATPVKIGEENDWAVVSAGSQSTCAVKKNGTLWCWGNVSNKIVAQPSQVGTEGLWETISVGRGIECVDPEWLSSVKKAAGAETKESAKTEILCMGIEHRCGIKQDGSLWCWGGNTYGEIGDGSTASREGPVRIGDTKDWISVVAGAHNTCATKKDDSLWCWGRNQDGQVGNGRKEHCSVPTKVKGPFLWKYAIPVGPYTIGLGQDGSGWRWGCHIDTTIRDGVALFGGGGVKGCKKNEKSLAPVRVIIGKTLAKSM